MSINKLFDVIESNNYIEDKAWFYDNLKTIQQIYAFYGVDYSLNNILNVIKNIKIVKGNENELTNYNYKTNTLSLVNLNENNEYYLLKSFLQITSQEGLVWKNEEGKEEWNYLNEIIIDRLILYTTGISKEEKEEEDLYYISEKDEKRAKEDELLQMIIKYIPLEELISSFANQNGRELYSQYFNEKNMNM